MLRTEQSDPEFFARLHREFKLVVTAEADLRERMLADYKFVDEEGGHWDKSTRDRREPYGQLCLQIDRLSGPIRQVLNQLSETMPAVKINPVDNGADRKKAEIRQAIIRDAEVKSNANMIKLLAAEHMVKIGRGYFRLVPEWDEDGVYQTPKFFPVDNPFSIYYDPRYQLPNGADARFALVKATISPRDYEERVGKEPPSAGSLDALQSTGDAAPDWFPEGKVTICEYYRVETTWEQKTQRDGTLGPRLQRRKVTWHLVNAVEELETTVIPGPYIPIIPVIGERTNINGVIDYKGMPRRGKDPQRMINYERSTMQELAGYGPRSPFIAAAGQTERYKNIWDNINTTPYGVAIYDPVAIGGTLAPKPDRAWSEPPIQAYLAMGREFENDLRAALGFFDVQGQERRPEQSGIAIKERYRQAELGNSHFTLGLMNANELAGRILLHWIPVYWDTPRVQELLGEDGTHKTALLHAGNAEAARQMAMQQNIPPDQVYDLSIGRYDVTVSTGPSYQTQRQESKDRLDRWVEAAPEFILPLGADLVFELLDDPVGRQLAARVRKQNPALSDEETPQQMPIPPKVKQQMEELSAQHAALTQIVQQQKEALETNQQKIEAELQMKQAELQMKRQQADEEAALEIEKAQIQVAAKIKIAEMEIAAKVQIARMEARMQADLHQEDLQHAEEMAQIANDAEQAQTAVEA